MNRRMGRQGGWVGMIVLLLALVIVAWLAKDALKGYGLVPDAETTLKRASTPGERTGSPVTGAVEHLDPTTSTPAPTSVIEKARSVEGMLKEQEGKRSAGY